MWNLSVQNKNDGTVLDTVSMPIDFTFEDLRSIEARVANEHKLSNDQVCSYICFMVPRDQAETIAQAVDEIICDGLQKSLT